MLDGRQGSFRVPRRVVVQGVLLGLHPPAHAGVGPAGEALRHEPARTRRERARQQRVGPLGAQPVGQLERAVEIPQVYLPDRGQLVHDDLGLRPLDGSDKP